MRCDLGGVVICYSKAEGGARCAGHAREALDKALSAYSEARTGGADDDEVRRLRDDVAAKRFAYHTTPEGRREAELEAENARAHLATLDRKGDAQAYNAAQQAAWDAESYLRTVRSTREAQETARSRHREVQAGDVGEQTKKALFHQDVMPHRVDVGTENYPRKVTQIGVLAVDESFSETDRSYQTASYWSQHEVQPGVYPVYLNKQGMVEYSYDTTITDASFPSTAYGQFLGDSGKEKVGTSERKHHTVYTFQMPPSYTPGLRFGGGSLVLHSGVELKPKVGHDRRTGRVTARTEVAVKEVATTVA